MRNFIELAALRVRIHQLTLQADDVLRIADRRGLNSDLLQRYEQLDTEIITGRMELVDGLRKHLAQQVEAP